MTTIKNHDVQSVNIRATTDKVFAYIANPTNLPKWTGAFKNADENSALLVTPMGELEIRLETKVNKQLGTIDWYMTMPDGSIGIAYSRVVANADKNTIYSFILLAPPAPIEEVEGALLQQIDILRKELQNLQAILER